MSDDEADPELLELLRQSLGIGGPKTDEVSMDTGTLKHYLTVESLDYDLYNIRYMLNTAIDYYVDALSGVLKDAEHIYNNSIDVSIDMYGTKGAAASIYKMMQERSYSTESWSQHELHPKQSEGFSSVDIVNFVFTMDLLNFSYAATIAASVCDDADFC